MVRLSSYFFLLLFVLVFQTVAYSWTLFPECTIQFPKEQEKLLEEGDLICRMGVGFWSGYFRVRNRTDKRFSHCGILVRKNDEWHVIHSSGNDATGEGKVTAEPLGTFASRSSYCAIYRFPYTTNERKQIAITAENYLGTPFDLNFDVIDHSKVYCSELIYLCINGALKREIIKPEELNDRPHVTIDDLYLKTKAKLILEVPVQRRANQDVRK